MLLDRGADANASDLDKGSALQSASFSGNANIVRSLLDHGADIDAQEGELWNPLHTAAQRGHEKVVQVLLDRGASVMLGKGSMTVLRFILHHPMAMKPLCRCYLTTVRISVCKPQIGVSKAIPSIRHLLTR